MMYHFVHFSSDNEFLTILKTFNSKSEANAYYNDVCHEYNGSHVDVLSDAALSRNYN